jgi:hypothetical protein
MGPWIPVRDGALEPLSVYLFGSPEGWFMFACGSERDNLLDGESPPTHYRLFSEGPPAQ